MYRYLAIVWNFDGLDGVQTSRRLRESLTSRSAEWPTAYEGPGALVVHKGMRENSTGAYRLGKDSGVILGKLFNRHYDQHVSYLVRFDEEEAQRVVASGGRHLVDHYWGPYVAIVRDNQRNVHHVLREPTANLPCYHTRYQDVDIFFSHIEDCVHLLPIRFSVNRDYLIRWLVVGRLMNQTCGLDNVENVLGGQRLTLSKEKIKRTSLWNPVEIARVPRFEQPDAAAKALRITVQESVSAWASCYQNIVHKLSGGLDSSIVAGCLAQAPSHPRVTYLNFSIDMESDQERTYLQGIDRNSEKKIRTIIGHGDERYFARLVAERWQVPLIEKMRKTSMQLTRLWEVPLMVNPPTYFASMELDDAEIEIYKSHGNEAFFSGQAGDSVLLATMQPLPAIDYFCLHGFKRDLWRHMVDTSTLSKESLWAVLAKVIKHGVVRRPYRSPISILDRPTLLREELAGNLTDEDFIGHWAKQSSLLPPGKQNHLRGLAGSAYFDGLFYSQAYADHIDPLNSQPIWEFMLQVPTYTILTGGVSRGLARQAFADLLPPQIRKRQVKGTGSHFYQQLVRQNRNLLRENLMDGLLVREGYLDRRRLDDCLAADEPFLDVTAVDLLCYLTAEIWLRRWEDIGQQIAAPQRSTQVFAQ